MRYSVLTFILLLFAGAAGAQEYKITFGSHSVIPPHNVTKEIDSAMLQDFGEPIKGRHYVIAQFIRVPTEWQRKQLGKKGVKLLDYVGGVAYFASVPEGVQAWDFAGTGMRSLIPIDPAWKMSQLLRPGNIPDWARNGSDVELVVTWFEGLEYMEIIESLGEKRLRFSGVSETFRRFTVFLEEDSISKFANYTWVQMIAPVGPPKTHFRGGRPETGSGSLDSSRRSLYERRGRDEYDGNPFRRPQRVQREPRQPRD